MGYLYSKVFKNGLELYARQHKIIHFRHIIMIKSNEYHIASYRNKCHLLWLLTLHEYVKIFKLNNTMT
jgi:hypothetical protein